MSRVWKHMLVTCTMIGVIVGALLAVTSHSKDQEMAQAVAPPEVEVVQVTQQDVPISSEWIGTLEGMVNATIKAQVTGYLLKQRYTEGAFVKQGQVLCEIDPRPFQAALDQAKGEQAKAQGQLVQANAQNNHRRYSWAVNRAATYPIGSHCGSGRTAYSGLPVVDLPRAPSSWAALGRWDQRCHERPGLIRQI